MVEKCANPTCSATFQRLRDGRLFVLEVPIDSTTSGKKPTRPLEYFWLCQSCCRTMTLIMNREVGVKVVPLHPNATSTRIAS
jgi:hypothetical protein